MRYCDLRSPAVTENKPKVAGLMTATTTTDTTTIPAVCTPSPLCLQSQTLRNKLTSTAHFTEMMTPVNMYTYGVHLSL